MPEFGQGIGHEHFKAPGDLATLHELLHRCGFDVVGELQKRLAEWKGSQRFNEIRATQLFLICSILHSQRAAHNRLLHNLNQ